MTKKQPYTYKEFVEETGIKIKPSETINVFQKGVSASGMRRYLDLYVLRDGELICITYHAAKLLGWRYNTKKEALEVDGCGMNMHLHTVDCLTFKIWGRKLPKSLKGNGGGCLGWKSIY